MNAIEIPATLLLTLMGLAALLIFFTVAWPWSPRTATTQAPREPAPLPERERAALERLVSLPHFRRLQDDIIFNFLNGITITRCECEQSSSTHLVVKYRNKEKVGLLTASALEQFVRVQEAVGAGLVENFPRTATPQE